MKKTLIFMALVHLVIVPVVQAGQTAEVGSIGFNVNGGINIPVSGEIASNTTFSDVFNVGPTFEARIMYLPMKHLTVLAGFDYSFLKMEDESRVGIAGEPYFTMPCVYIDGILNIGDLINNPDNILNPYVLAGGGLYFWKVTDDGVGGDAILLENGEDFSKTSFGLQFGAGLEVFATPQLSIFVEGKYHHIFSEDTDEFGDKFSNLGTISVNAGVTYYVPLGSK
jgi:opacity protein-like surface antigen